MYNQMVNWGILGTSYISEVMASAIQESRFSNLIAVASRSKNKGQMFSQNFSVRTCYDDYYQLLNDPDIHAVYIGLPNHLHKEWILNCIKAGKHILCEKPLVTNNDEALEISTILKSSNLICMEALMYRCHPFTMKLHDLIKNKIIGDIKLINATYTANIAHLANPTLGGSIRNLGCYPVSLVRLLIDSKIVEMNAVGRVNEITGNDNQASMILKFENNCMGVISTADDLEMFWQFDLHGTEGCLKVLTNPWLPEKENNQIWIKRNNQSAAELLNITAEKSLYTHQIDVMYNKIMGNAIDEGISMEESAGNVDVLYQWLQMVNA